MVLALQLCGQAQFAAVHAPELGIQQFVGQYATDWNAVLASLSLAIVPVVTLYALFSRQLIRGITAGAVK